MEVIYLQGLIKTAKKLEPSWLPIIEKRGTKFKLKFKLRSKEQLWVPKNEKMEKLKGSTDKKQEWYEIWVASFCFMSRTGVRVSHTELSRFSNRKHSFFCLQPQWVHLRHWSMHYMVPGSLSVTVIHQHQVQEISQKCTSANKRSCHTLCKLENPTSQTHIHTFLHIISWWTSDSSPSPPPPPPTYTHITNKTTHTYTLTHKN